MASGFGLPQINGVDEKDSHFFFFYCLLNLFRNWDSVAVAVAF